MFSVSVSVHSKYSGFFQEVSYLIGLLSLTGALSISLNIILPPHFSLLNMCECALLVFFFVMCAFMLLKFQCTIENLHL